MKVIGHKYRGIDFYMGKMEGDLIPAISGKDSFGVKDHFVLNDLPKYGDSLMGADCNKVRIRPRVVNVFESWTSMLTFFEWSFFAYGG